MHLNLNQNHKKHRNLLNNFHLQGHTKKSYAFRCSEKQEHLNSAKTQIQAPNAFTPSVLKEIQQQYPRFRCSAGLNLLGLSQPFLMLFAASAAVEKAICKL